MSYISAKLLREVLKNDFSLIQNINDFLNVFPDGETVALKKRFGDFQKWLARSKRNHATNNDDFRFCHVLIKNFRRYGTWKENGSYGIKLVAENKSPYSELFLLGDNGVGKSSVFGALEYWATGIVGEAQLRRIDESDLESYIGYKNPEIQVHTVNGHVYGINNDSIRNRPYDFQRFFISENCILESASYMPKETEGNNWFLYLCYMLGIHKELIDFTFRDDSGNLFGWRSDLPDELTKIESKRDESIKSLFESVSVMTLDDANKDKLNNLKVFLSQKSTEWKNASEQIDWKQEITSVLAELSALQHVHIVRELEEKCRKTLSVMSQEQRPAEIFKKESLLQENLMIRESAKVDKSLVEELRENLDQIGRRLNDLLGEKKEFKDLLRNNVFLNKFDSKLIKKNINLHSLDVSLQTFRKSLKEAIEAFVREQVDDDFKKTVEENFSSFFMSGGKKLNFNIKEKDKNLYYIDVDGIPVHKYFNTFRFRLFCLSLQVAVNLKMMKKYKFSFPMVFDDVFYANDYKNKRQLTNFFYVLSKQATTILGKNNNLQVLFFTHDEQLIATLQKKFNAYHYGRMLNPDEYKDCHFQIVGSKEKRNDEYYNLYFSIYNERDRFF